MKSLYDNGLKIANKREQTKTSFSLSSESDLSKGQQTNSPWQRPGLPHLFGLSGHHLPNLRNLYLFLIPSDMRLTSEYDIAHIIKAFYKGLKRKVSLMFLLTLMPLLAASQGQDFGTNLSVGLHISHTKKFGTSYEVEMRTRDDVSAIDRLSLRSQANYKLLSWLKVSGGLSFLYDHNKRISRYDENDKDVIRGNVSVGAPKNLRDYWGPRLRGDISLIATHKIGHLKLSLRERWQYTYRFRRLIIGRYNYLYKKGDNAGHVFSGKGKNVLRSRLEAEVKIPNTSVTPFVSIEAFNAWDLEKIRYTAGASWKINKRHTLEAYYRYQDVSYDDDYEPNRHILGISYQYHIKK